MEKLVCHWLFLIILFTQCWALAKDDCHQFYKPMVSVVRNQQVKNLEARLNKYFGSEWAQPKEASDAKSAKRLFQKLKKYGTDSDLKYFDVYLKIFESTTGYYEVRTPGFYVDLLMGERPKSNFFQERHWDWHIIEGYFLNGPLIVSVSKDQDLKYLEHVLQTAVDLGNIATLKQVLQQANHTWAIKELSTTGDITKKYSDAIGNKAYDDLYAEFKFKIKKWIDQGAASKALRSKQTEFALEAFANSNSKLDLYIMNKYFDLLRKFGVASKYWPHESVPKWLQLTDWRVYEMALPYPSMHYMTDFLFQNSHDIAAKKYLLEILTRLEQLKTKKYGDVSEFYFQFLEARGDVDKARSIQPAPANYQNDLHIFSPRIYPDLPGGYSDYDQTMLAWNPMLRRLQGNVVSSRWLDGRREHNVEHDPQLVAYVKTYFDTLRKNGSFTESEIAHDEQIELKAPLNLTTYLSFTKPNEQHRLLALIRIFDGTYDKTYIEREFPHIHLPRSSNGEKTMELGRLFASHLAESESFLTVMAGVAEYLKMANIKGDLYFDCNRAGMNFYRRRGASIVYAPQHLNLPEGKTSLWVMKYSTDDLIRLFLRPEYSSVKLRE
tara:strand:- start:41644 stop:43464 length:1821 start_codon:yes stop_codon:yes gene_type:complete